MYGAIAFFILHYPGIFTPEAEVVIKGGASGQNATLVMSYLNGGTFAHTVVVPANDELVIEGQFNGIVNSGTSFTANTVFPFI